MCRFVHTFVLLSYFYPSFFNIWSTSFFPTFSHSSAGQPDIWLALLAVSFREIYKIPISNLLKATSCGRSSISCLGCTRTPRVGATNWTWGVASRSGPSWTTCDCRHARPSRWSWRVAASSSWRRRRSGRFTVSVGSLGEGLGLFTFQGPFKCYVALFSGKFTHPPTNIEPYTFVLLFPRKCYTPTPYCVM